MKMRRRKTLCKYVYQLITSCNVMHLKVTAKNPFTNRVIINFNMLGSGMKDKIGSNGKGRNVVTPKLWWKGKEDTKIFQNLTNPTELSCSNGKSPVIELSGGSRDSVLFLSTPYDSIEAKINQIANSGSTIKRISSPIRVKKG